MKFPQELPFEQIMEGSARDDSAECHSVRSEPIQFVGLALVASPKPKVFFCSSNGEKRLHLEFGSGTRSTACWLAEPKYTLT